MTAVAITGHGSHLPRQRIGNDRLHLERPLTEQQLERIGVRTRYWAEPDEGIVEMAAAAAGQALARAGQPASVLDLIILSNWTQRRYIPDFAPRLKHQLGAERAFAFDVSCACAGFLVGLATARALLADTGRRTALVVASETTSQRARPGGRSTLLYSDGAGAFVLDTAPHATSRLIDSELVTLSDHHDLMDVTAGGYVRSRVAQRELVALAVGSIVDTATALLERNSLTLQDIDWLIPHSGSAGIQALLRERLGDAADRVLTNLPLVGNVSSASIPLAVDHFVAQGVIRPGQLILAVSVGTGFYATAALFTL